MKSKILCVLLAICLFASLVPLTVSAADPTVTVGFSNIATEKRFSVDVAPGETKYVTSNDAKEFVAWTDAAAPADKFVKLEYPADGKATLKVTLKNIDADCTSAAYKSPCIEFKAGEYAVVMDVQGTNSLTHGNSACIFYEAAKGLTISGAGTLNLNNSMSVDGSIWARGGDLLLKNTQININCTIENTSIHSAILSAKGNVNIEGCKLVTKTSGGALVFMGTMTEKVGRHTPDTATDRFIKIKDSEITHTSKVRGFTSATPVSISNSTMTMTLTSTGGSATLFNIAPTFEGEYTAIAGLAKNADKLDKLKVFDAKKLGSYTYFHVVPGIVELLPTTPPTEPEATTPDATTPDTTTPDATTPDATTPEASTPDATTPDASTPDATTPDESKPATDNKPSESKPTQTDNNTATENATDEDENNGGKKNNTTTIILIVAIVLVVAAGGALGIIFFLKKKKA